MTPFDRAAPLAEEAALRTATPVFVNAFEQLTYVRDTVAWLARAGFASVTVLDQGSTHPAHLAWYDSADFRGQARLVRLKANLGPRRAVKKAAQMAGMGSPFIFTDPDLDLPRPVPGDFLTRMFRLGLAHGVTKVGLALDVFDAGRVRLDLPLGRGQTVASYNRRFYRHALEESVWAAGVDTTFFLHVPDPGKPGFGILSSQPRIPAVRVGGAGWLAGHRPWHHETGLPAEELAYYRARCSPASTLYGRGQA